MIMRATALGFSSPALAASPHAAGHGVVTSVHDSGARAAKAAADHASCQHGTWSGAARRTPRVPSPATHADRTIGLPAHARSVAPARRFATARLAEWNLPHLADTLSLLVSEVVTNAVVHVLEPQRNVHVTLSHRAGSVLVEVSDQGSDVPRTRTARQDEEGGRGLWLVQELSDGWGIRPATAGKTVWFRLGSQDEGRTV